MTKSRFNILIQEPGLLLGVQSILDEIPPDNAFFRSHENHSIFLYRLSHQRNSYKRLKKIIDDINPKNQYLILLIDGEFDTFIPLVKTIEVRAICPLKLFDTEKLLEIMTQWIYGSSYIDKSYLSEIIKSKYDDMIVQLRSISRRELEVIDKVALDETNEAIAHSLELSKRTINAHKRNILRKLKVKHMEGAISYYLKYGIPFFSYYH